MTIFIKSNRKEAVFHHFLIFHFFFIILFDFLKVLNDLLLAVDLGNMCNFVPFGPQCSF